MAATPPRPTQMVDADPDPAESNRQAHPPASDDMPVPGPPDPSPPLPGGRGVPRVRPVVSDPPPGGGVRAAPSVFPATMHPPAAAPTWTISGWPPTPAPGAMVTLQRSPASAAVTIECPSPS